MTEIKEKWKELILEHMRHFAAEKGIGPEALDGLELLIEKPPKPEMGDLAFPMFPLARIFRMGPPAIAAALAERVAADPEARKAGTAEAAGPYLNIRIAAAGLAEDIVTLVRQQGDGYGRNKSMESIPVVVEFSCPNTNKPLHLGHLRNDSLGSSVARILEANGAEVRKVNLINDRGIHICKSMLAYQKFGEGTTPESEGVKSDHFVGHYYVRFNQWAKQEPEAEKMAQAMLRKWEAGDEEVHKLWLQMNRWAIEGVEETYQRTDIAFDKVYYESETYASGREEVLKGLEAGHFYRDEDGSVWVDLSEINLDKKVLLRSDGTTLYLTQDIGTAIARHKDWPFKEMIYVVGSEQEYHFKVLFYVLEKLGFAWARNLYHLSYGMVNLPEGKMKSREGTVVDADDLLDQLKEMALKEIREKERENEVDDLEATGHAIALGALNYYLLQVSPGKDMIFNPRESLAFNGNTGPYLQYTGARLSSMLRKYTDMKTELGGAEFRPEKLVHPDEKELLKLIAEFPAVVEQAGSQRNPSLIGVHLYGLAKVFSRYYHDNPVLHNQDKELVETRVQLAGAVRQVIKNGCTLIGVPFLEKM